MIPMDEKMVLGIIAIISIILNIGLLWELNTADRDFDEMVDFYENLIIKTDD